MDPSNYIEYNQDPKFYDKIEIQFRTKQQSMNYYRTEFEPALEKGSTIKVSDEIILNVNENTGHEAVVYGEHGAAEQTFVVDQSQEVAERIYDTDKMRSVFDVKAVIESNGLFQLNNTMDRYRFQKLKENSKNLSPVIDISTGTNLQKGDKLFNAILDAGLILDAVDNGNTRSTAFGRVAYRFLKDAGRLTAGTESAETRMERGVITLIDNIFIDKTENVYKDSDDFSVAAKGIILVGARTATVDGVGINPPQIGDTFPNVINGVSETFTIQAVTEVTAATEYIISWDKPLGTQIADDAAITVTGYHTEYIPVVQGVPGQAVVQKDPQFELLRDPVYHAWLVRSLIVHDAFLSDEMARHLVILPVKYRAIT